MLFVVVLETEQSRVVFGVVTNHCVPYKTNNAVTGASTESTNDHSTKHFTDDIRKKYFSSVL